MPCFALPRRVTIPLPRGSPKPRANQGNTMSEPSHGTQPPTRPLDDRLDSWKESGVYLKRDVTTVQRWEKREGMPVHRHQHDKIGSVYAFRSELDAWSRGRNLPSAEENSDKASLSNPAVSPPRPAITASIDRWKSRLPLAMVVAALAIGAILWLQKTEYFW